jgi:hypothetical protein
LIYNRAVRLRFLVLGCLALLLPAPTAWAHAGGRAQLYIATATVAPGNGGWTVTTALRDLDSGAPQPGFAVEVSGTGPAGAAFGPVALADADGTGRYQGPLPAVADGAWALTVRASEVPGGNAALPVQRTYNVTLRPGQSLDLSKSGAAGSGKGGGSSTLPIFLGVLALLAAAVGGGAWFGRHRRAMVPAR